MQHEPGLIIENCGAQKQVLDDEGNYIINTTEKIK
jgi:hypothetical protein